MRKRALIFAPEVRDREEITGVIRGYFLKNFENYLTQIEIQKYSMLNEPPTKDYLGHWYEVFVVFDQRFSPKEKRSKEFKKTPYYKALKASYEMSVALCEKRSIPYIIYQGEIAKEEEKKLIAKIEKLKEQIKGRLEAKL